MAKTDIRGSLVALVTPMSADGELDLPAFDRLVDWHIDAGTHGIVVVGTTGESATLSTEEHCDLVAHCVRKVAGRVPVIAGTGSNNTQEALLFTREAKQHGADACLLVTPYYTKPPQEGLYQHFKLLAEQVDIPQILYNVPGRTVCDLSLETVERLADIDNIVAIKDATGDLERGLELVKRVGDRLAVFSGEDPLNVELMAGGAAGCISVTANVVPDVMARICDLLASDAPDAAAQARALDAEIAPLHKNLFLQANPIPVKWALHRLGRIDSGIRLPLVELAESLRLQVEEAMTASGLKLP
ncbi:MAG: 4-hydroxy-tetrahydrodipicolinate synthase [Pseudohongiellaceae bacterium]